MKIALSLIILTLSFSAFAAKPKKSAKPKVEKAEEEEKIVTREEKDFFFICETSKLAKALKKSGLFEDEAERTKLIAKMQKTFITSMEAKEALQAAASNPDQAAGLLQRAAKEAGIKKWNCPTAGELAQ